MILLKEGRSTQLLSAYRPICLIDEARKLFERIVVARFIEHLQTEGPDLAECQYGFQEGGSIVNAIMHVKAFSEEIVTRDEVYVAVSLDISNAFNILPWARIRKILRYHRVSPYLRGLPGS